ncbi:hypothetical protein ACFFX0_09640 [Citricoccus parietis]|uniref:Uncharacterized protein n=1 Tax=Citricoccus parietis TaxID=592307 RepID=A0ABV5FXN1_9MICC
MLRDGVGELLLEEGQRPGVQREEPLLQVVHGRQVGPLQGPHRISGGQHGVGGFGFTGVHGPRHAHHSMNRCSGPDHGSHR